MPAAKLADCLSFIGQFRRNYQTVGSLVPSSRYLARAITRLARETPRPARFLEAGPGTGPFTDELIRLLEPGDQLTLVELNNQFVEILSAKLRHDPVWKARSGQVRLVHGSIAEVLPGERYHAVVCGLPFNNFEPALVRSLLGNLLGRLEPGGSLSFFEYLWIRRLKSPFVSPSERKRLGEIGKIFDHVFARSRVASDRVVRNVPPAVAHHLRAPSETAATPGWFLE